MKSSIDQLAVFGNPPLFDSPLHVGCPNLGDRRRFLQRVNDALDRRWLTNGGPFVKEFEQRVAAMLSVKHCIAICNGTVALEVAIRALQLTGEVIVPANTFVATAHALQWQEITPVFCDVDPQTHTLDPEKVVQMLTPRTSAIIGVHLWGRPCDISGLENIARRFRLKLLFDASHAFGCTYQGKMIGRFGDAEVFSFHATKFVNTLEGGAIVTNDDDLAAKIRLMKNFGFAQYDTVTYIGTNGKMNELSAAMGLTSLDAMEEFTRINFDNYWQYQTLLKGVPGISMLSYDSREQCNYQYVVLELDPAAGVTRDQLVHLLHSENILARRYFYPGCHRMEPYRSFFPHAGLLLPETERLLERVVCLPTGTAVNGETVDRICRLIRLICENGVEISRRLSGENLSAARPLAGENQQKSLWKKPASPVLND